MRVIEKSQIFITLTILVGGVAFLVTTLFALQIDSKPTQESCQLFEVFLPHVLNNYWVFESEDNDEVDFSNGPLSSGQNHYGFPDDEWDVYYFDVQISGEIVVQVDNHMAGGRSGVGLFKDSDNALVGEKYDPPDYDEIIYQGAPDRYYVVVRTDLDDFYDSTKAYTLLVTYPLPMATPQPLSTCVPPGSGWVPIGENAVMNGGISNSNGLAYSPNMVAPVVNGMPQPIVTWVDTKTIPGSDPDIFASRWIEDSWETLHEDLLNGIFDDALATSSYPSLESINDEIFIAWANGSPPNQYIYLMKYDELAKTWVSATGNSIISQTGESDTPILAANSFSDTFYVAWHDHFRDQIYVRGWNIGLQDWVDLGPVAASGGGITNTDGVSYNPDMAVNADNMPYVVWQESISDTHKIYMRCWGASQSCNGIPFSRAWQDVGNFAENDLSMTNNDSVNPTVAVTADGRVYVAWQEEKETNSEIYLRWYDTTESSGVWLPMTAQIDGSLSSNDSASGEGISWKNSDALDSRNPSIAVAPNGNLYLAWEQEVLNGQTEIYVLRYSQSKGEWEELGHSASFGGVSNTSDFSRSPQIVLTKDSNLVIPYVVWEEVVDGQTQIYGRYYLEE